MNLITCTAVHIKDNEYQLFSKGTRHEFNISGYTVHIALEEHHGAMIDWGSSTSKMHIEVIMAMQRHIVKIIQNNSLWNYMQNESVRVVYRIISANGIAQYYIPHWPSTSAVTIINNRNEDFGEL